MGALPLALALAVFFGSPWILPWLGGAGARLAVRAYRRVRPARVTPQPHRPVEEIAADVRLRGLRFHRLDPRAAAAKQAAVASGYDRVLAELCAALGETHLLNVLPGGPELDAERRRVELVLMCFGLPPADAA